MAKTEEKQISINGIKVNYKCAGQGPVCLILHGWGSSSVTWEKLQNFLSDQGYKTYILDLPGFGKSDNPPQAWSVSDYVHFTLKVTDGLKLGKFFLLGHSFGGRIGIQLSAAYSHRLKGLILCAAAGIKKTPNAKQKAYFFLAKAGKYIIPFKKARSIIYGIFGPSDCRNVKGIMRETFKKVVSDDLRPYLGQIKVPTLIVWGENDAITPLSDAYIMKKEIIKSELIVIPKIGHSIQLQEPEQLAKAVLIFFKKQS